MEFYFDASADHKENQASADRGWDNDKEGGDDNRPNKGSGLMNKRTNDPKTTNTTRLLETKPPADNDQAPDLDEDNQAERQRRNRGTPVSSHADSLLETKDEKKEPEGSDGVLAKSPKAKQYTDAQIAAANKANEKITKDRKKVNDYLDVVRDRKSAGQTLDAKGRKDAWAKATRLQDPTTMDYWIERNKIILGEEMTKPPTPNRTPSPPPGPRPTPTLQRSAWDVVANAIVEAFDLDHPDLQENIEENIDIAIDNMTGPGPTDFDPRNGPTPPPGPTGSNPNKKETETVHTPQPTDLSQVQKTLIEAAVRIYIAREQAKQRVLDDIKSGFNKSPDFLTPGVGPGKPRFSVTK